jgi:hypothetical protein
MFEHASSALERLIFPCLLNYIYKNPVQGKATMTTVDSKSYLANGGYLQKGAEKNVHPEDLGKKVLDLLPSRWADMSLFDSSNFLELIE